MKMRNYFFIALLLSLSVSACNNSGNKQDAQKEADKMNKKMDVMNQDDAQFMTDVASAGMMEVEGGKIALQKGTHTEVKDFGQKMIDDHGKANAELRDLASRKNVVLPDSMSNADQKKIDKLNNTKSSDFDKTYMDMMVDDHESAVSAFQKEADKAQDADLKAWVQKTLPVLQHHLDMAKTDKDMLKK